MAKRTAKSLDGPGKRQKEKKARVGMPTHVILLIKGKLMDDNPFWVIVAVNPMKYQAFQDAVRDATLDLYQFDDYGEIVVSGESEEPPDGLMDEVISSFKFDPPSESLPADGNEEAEKSSTKSNPSTLEKFVSAIEYIESHEIANFAKKLSLAGNIELIHNIKITDYESSTQGSRVPLLEDEPKPTNEPPPTEQRPEFLAALLAKPPKDASYEVKAKDAAAKTHALRQQIATELAPALNARIQELPHDTLEQKKELARWVNDQLEPLGLAVQCPKTGLPAKLWGIKGSYKPGEMNGSFCFEVSKDGKKVKSAYSDALPVLTLTDAATHLEPDKSGQQVVGSQESRSGRTHL